MAEALVMTLLDISIPFVVECDVFDVGIEVILIQQVHAIAYFSTSFEGEIFSLLTYRKEGTTLVIVVKKWQPYLLGQHFVV